MEESEEKIIPQECESCISNNFPELAYEPDKQNLEWGIKEASYITGFVGAINALGFSESTLKEIALNKIMLEYQKEMLRMKLETEERIATIYSKSPLLVVKPNSEE